MLGINELLLHAQNIPVAKGTLSVFGFEQVPEYSIYLRCDCSTGIFLSGMTTFGINKENTTTIPFEVGIHHACNCAHCYLESLNLVQPFVPV